MERYNFKRIDTRKFFGTIIGGIFFIYCVLFFTYAYYEWKSDNTSVVLTITESIAECVPGADIEVINIGPVLNVSDGVKVDFLVENVTSSQSNVNLRLLIESISEELKVESFKYALVVDIDGGTAYDYDNILLEDNFDLASKSNDVWNEDDGILNLGDIVIAGDSIYSYQFIVYIDGAIYNSLDMQGKSLIGSLELGNCSVSDDNDSSGIDGKNTPNLDGGNLIPVYYDDSEGVETWKKADSNNVDNSWYDYENKMWANAVLISNNSSIDYTTVDVGTVIAEDDIIAFYVWIPRYKYRVWNITRQGADESTYAYTAYSTGIEIAFENGVESTGNVECSYTASTSSSNTLLSDDCYYNGSSTPILSTDSNSSYSDAWYTHPAFTFDGVDKTGFWIGKFETSGSADNPMITPDNISLTNQDVSAQFNTSRVFQNYLSDNIEAHMLTNLEWGAVAYLAHSIYGLCDDVGCRDVYVNNSEDYYTGRSGGIVAGSEEDAYNTYGYYDYKGNQLNNNGTVSGAKDVTKVASTTGNISGVYDMSGGAYEYVMGNMVNSSGDFSISGASNYWNSNNLPANKYFNSYSYYLYSESNAASFNRARLGDATSEVLTCSAYNCVWRGTGDSSGAYSVFVSAGSEWFSRGGSADEYFAGSFCFYSNSGSRSIYDTFRSSLS